MDYSLVSAALTLIMASQISIAITPGRPPGDISLDYIEEPPEGYYAFIEAPNAEPPKVRRPPYVQSDIECPGQKKGGGKLHPANKKALSLCGDLNKGYIPKNPMRQNVLGHAYPFDLIKNKTLQFFSKTLPILKADETLPKVAKYVYNHEEDENAISDYNYREKRDVSEEIAKKEKSVTPEQVANVANGTLTRTGRKFCDTNDGVLCMLYKALQGDALSLISNGFSDRRDDFNEMPEYRRGEMSLPPTTRDNLPPPAATPRDGPLPPTPCPAKVEYATPVFARNYQGVWRYVVQIPYEGYFTQTIEVTRCLNSRCHYMEGGCMSSPRWTSILVAEIYYPETFLPKSSKSSSAPPSDWSSQAPRQPVSSDNPPPVQDFQNYQQYLQKRAGTAGEEQAPAVEGDSDLKKPTHCDGVDEIGCFQVRLYYDWFLVPGSCKCWRPDYFSRYMRRKMASPDL